MAIDSQHFDNLTPVLQDIATLLERATSTELLLATALPLLSLLIAIRLSRWFHQLPRTTFRARIADYAVPLLTPALSLIFMGIGLGILKGLSVTPLFLPFLIKVLLAWLAMRVVILVSSREIAGWFIALVIIPVTALELLGLWNPLVTLMQEVKFHIGKTEFDLYLVLKTIVAVIALFWVASFLTRLTERRLRRMRHLHASNRALILKIFQIFLYFVVFVVGLQAVGVDITALSFFGGALGVALGLGLQKTASNFVSGIILLFEKSVEIGDVVELADGSSGMVRQTSTRYTLIEMIDGKEVLIPNEELINQRVINWTHSHARGRVEIILQVAFTADIEKARAIMLECAIAHDKCLTTPKPMCIYSRFPEGNVEITLYFWIADMADGRLEPRSDVIHAIWQRFRTEGIETAPPQRILWERR